MKRRLTLFTTVVIVFGFMISAHATLILRGTDTLGNQLIYDDDLDITWYDFSNPINTWANQVSWASALIVDFGGSIGGWRLPTALNQDGSGPCSGFNCNGNEMGHLYYTELGNPAGGPLIFTGPFTNLQSSFYWSGTGYVPNPGVAWLFDFFSGKQLAIGKGANIFALAVHPGDVSAPIPEPSTLLLLSSGILGLAGMRKKLKVKTS